VLNNGWTAARDYGHVDHGLVVPATRSGQDGGPFFVRPVVQSFAASSREQFYVSAPGRVSSVVSPMTRRALTRRGTSDERLTAQSWLRGLDTARHHIVRENAERSMQEQSAAVAQRRIERRAST